MLKQAITVLAALSLAGCMSYSYPIRDAGDGVYFAASAPQYVYVDYPAYLWAGPPFLYPSSDFRSPFDIGIYRYRSPHHDIAHFGAVAYVPTPYRPPVHANVSRQTTTGFRGRNVRYAGQSRYRPIASSSSMSGFSTATQGSRGPERSAGRSSTRVMRKRIE
jgi:hypothetical protein